MSSGDTSIVEKEELISQDAVEKLLETPYTFLHMIAVLKEVKKGDGVTLNLPM